MTDPLAELVDAATVVRERAYAPYSGFRVGAAVRGASGGLHVGCNVENAAFPAGVCAETHAVGAAVAAGERAITAVAVVVDAAEPAAPCGVCRQVLAELGPTAKVVLATVTGAELRTSVDALLPHAFGPASLDRG